MYGEDRIQIRRLLQRRSRDRYLVRLPVPLHVELIAPEWAVFIHTWMAISHRHDQWKRSIRLRIKCHLEIFAGGLGLAQIHRITEKYRVGFLTCPKHGDIEALISANEPNIEGVVIGRALYDGKIEPKQALAVVNSVQNR